MSTTLIEALPEFTTNARPVARAVAPPGPKLAHSSSAAETMKIRNNLKATVD
jgi:hypothetical protein